MALDEQVSAGRTHQLQPHSLSSRFVPMQKVMVPSPSWQDSASSPASSGSGSTATHSSQ